MTNSAIIQEVAAHFLIERPLIAAEPFGGGHINHSWLLTTSGPRYLLQGINQVVFQQPLLVMENLERILRHLSQKPEQRTLTLIPTTTGSLYYQDDRGGVWRLFLFIEGTLTRQQPAGVDDAYAAASAFGTFQRCLSDLPGPRLHETIPGFHDTPTRVSALERVAAADPMKRSSGAMHEIDRILADAHVASLLLDPLARGEIQERLAHNDAKIANVLFDQRTGEALCVIDLDTVMPGLSLYDFGDMARSMASRAAEDEQDADKCTVDVDLFLAVVKGFLVGAEGAISKAEKNLLVAAARVFAYEQALRFLKDHLEGDVYYRVERPGQNMDRCRTQLSLLDAFTMAEDELMSGIEGLDLTG